MKETDIIVRLAKAIGYPQEVPAGTGGFDFMVDGEVITVEVEVKGFGLGEGEGRGEGGGEGRILLKTVLTEDEEIAGRLAAYAAGRLLKEDAVLAWDLENRAMILWNEMKGLGEGEQRRRFESFCESADWWRDRVAEENPGLARVPEMMIRP